MQREAEAAANGVAEWQCCQVVLRFTGHFDAREYGEMEQYFAPDGVWHRADGNIEGREGLRHSMRARPPGLFVRHVITNLRASILSPSEAVVEFLCHSVQTRLEDRTRHAAQARSTHSFRALLRQAQKRRRGMANRRPTRNR